MRDVLKRFKTLSIGKAQLQRELGEDLYKLKTNHPMIITNLDVIFILERLQKGEISVSNLVDWVNVIWFSELYAYATLYQDAIASVMNELEELDEDGRVITQEKIEAYMNALKENKEI